MDGVGHYDREERFKGVGPSRDGEGSAFADQRLSDAAASVWAKSAGRDFGWLPLWRHLDDTAAVAGQLWDRWLPAATRRLIAEALPDGDADGRRLTVWLAGVHDIGKATPAFAVKVRFLADSMRDQGLAMPEAVPYQERMKAGHATTGHLLLERWLAEVYGWWRPQSRQFAVVVGGHHGAPPTALELNQAADRPCLLGLGDCQESWQLVQRELLDRAAIHLGVADRLPSWRDVKLSQPVQVLLTGLVTIADGIASNEELFPYDPERLHAPSRLDHAWDGLDLPAPWQAVPFTGDPADLVADRFDCPAGATDRPVPAAAVELARRMPAAGLLLIEAPMGEGKTEAALAAAEQLAARGGAGGCFVTLPARSSCDAMFTRVRDLLARAADADAAIDPQALEPEHDGVRPNNDFPAFMRRGHRAGIDRDVPHGSSDWDPRRWLVGRKKATLAPFVVGTIDQLLLGALKSRHLALRHLGLAGKS